MFALCKSSMKLRISIQPQSAYPPFLTVKHDYYLRSRFAQTSFHTWRLVDERASRVDGVGSSLTLENHLISFHLR